ncbi:MAG: hypothetical protein Q7J68_03830 [Thermoplasmata archaeon]|nr:hypothetical protein [Thermoplasmata archaeon]
MAYQPPVMVPNETVAKSRIFNSFMLRAHTDKQISTSWVGAILAFQVILPLIAIMFVFWMFNGTNPTFGALNFVMLLLIVLLMGIVYVIVQGVLVFKLVDRRDNHFLRDRNLRVGMEEYVAASALTKQMDLNVERWTMNTISQGNNDIERSPLMWAMLVSLIAIIPIVGIIFLVYSQAFLTKDVQSHDEKQRSYNQYFEASLMKTGKITQPIYQWQPIPRRDVAIYTILTILTVGFFLPYWWYVNIQDMNAHMQNQMEFENRLVQLLQAEG